MMEEKGEIKWEKNNTLLDKDKEREGRLMEWTGPSPDGHFTRGVEMASHDGIIPNSPFDW